MLKIDYIKNLSSFDQEYDKVDDIIKKYYYFQNDDWINLLSEYFNISDNNNLKILDIGGELMNHYKYANIFINIQKGDDRFINVDIDYEKIPFYDKNLYLSYSRHTLEDIQNPKNVFDEMVRTSLNAYIETPSPLCEITKSIDLFGKCDWRGYNHHRYIIWSNIENNTLYFLPKYPIIEILKYNDLFLNKIKYILNNYPIYWNNYYIFDKNHKPNIFIYRNGINYENLKNYPELLLSSIEKSMNYTNYLIELFYKKSESKKN